MNEMNMRLVFATPDPASVDLMRSMLASAMDMLCLETTVSKAETREELLARVAGEVDDIVFLDWPLVEAGTPELVREMLDINPRLRVVVLLPLSYRQYRQMVWESGACNSIPKEHMDQEWLSSILCVMQRAMQREARLLERFENDGHPRMNTKEHESAAVLRDPSCDFVGS